VNVSNWTAGTHFLVYCLLASSIAQDTVPRWSQPYASTPRVLPSNFLRLHGLWMDLSNGSNPVNSECEYFGSNSGVSTLDSHSE
jgi:hypothetical protein